MRITILVTFLVAVTELGCRGRSDYKVQADTNDKKTCTDDSKWKSTNDGCLNSETNELYSVPVGPMVSGSRFSRFR